MHPIEATFYILGIMAILTVTLHYIITKTIVLIQHIIIRRNVSRMVDQIRKHPSMDRETILHAEAAERLANKIFMETQRVFMSPIRQEDGEADSTCQLCALCAHKMNKLENTEFQTLEPNTYFRCTECGFELDKKPESELTHV